MTLHAKHYVLCLLFASVLLIGSGRGASQTPQPGSWLDHWRLATFSFGSVEQDQNGRQFYKVIGTGFFVALDEKNGYIVTAKHVFDEPSKNWHPAELRMRFSWQEHKSVYDEFGTILKLRDESGRPLWKALEDGSDIVAIPPQTHFRDGPIDAIFARDFAGKDDVFEGGSIIVIGYPGVIGNEYLVRSIIRGGIVAWTDPDLPFDKPLLIDSNVFPGNSGSPVLRIPIGLSREGMALGGQKPTLLGLVSAGPIQQTDMELRVPGATDPIRFKAETVGVGGIGIVAPASKILKLLNQMPRVQ